VVKDFKKSIIFVTTEDIMSKNSSALLSEGFGKDEKKPFLLFPQSIIHIFPTKYLLTIAFFQAALL